MPKNKKKKKGGGKSLPERERSIHDLVNTDGHEYAFVTKLLGNRRVQLKCMDGKNRLGRIRGNSKKKRVFINLNDYVLIGLRDYQDEKADVLDKYTETEVKRLRYRGELPEEYLQTNDNSGFTFGEIDINEI